LRDKVANEKSNAFPAQLPVIMSPELFSQVIQITWSS